MTSRIKRALFRHLVPLSVRSEIVDYLEPRNIGATYSQWLIGRTLRCFGFHPLTQEGMDYLKRGKK